MFTIKAKAIQEFITECKRHGYSPQSIIDQLYLYCSGARGVSSEWTTTELSDLCIILIDGTERAEI